jgi:hypothetical protein
MPPHAIMICAQQDAAGFVNARGLHLARPGGVALLVGAHVGEESDWERSVQNRDCNLSIEGVEITVNTSERTVAFSADKKYLLDKRRLFADTQQACNQQQSKIFGGDYTSWSDRNCVVYLTSDKFLPLSISPGMIVPLNVTVTVRFRNRCVYLDGINRTVGRVIEKGAAAIRAQPVLLAFYQRSVATIAPASMTIGTNASSMATGQEVLAQNR